GETGITYIVEGHTGFQLIYAEKRPSGWIRDTADPDTAPFAVSAGPEQITNSLVIDANGVPHIAFFGGGPGGPGIRHATWTTAGRGFWAISGFGELVDKNGQPSLAKILLDKNNVLHIAYQASQGPASTTELRFATRTVSGWATTTVD